MGLNSKYKAILFDLDGTLTDPKEGITNCISYALEKLGHKKVAASELEKYIGPPLQESLAELLKTEDGEIIDRALSYYRERFQAKGMFENEVYPDVKNTLEELKNNGHSLYVATSKPHVYATKIISHFKLDSFFQKVHGSELDGTRRNKADLISYILDVESLDPKATLMIGDRKHDILGAKTCGVDTLAVTFGYGSQTELRNSEPGFLCDKFSQIPTVVLKHTN